MAAADFILWFFLAAQLSWAQATAFEVVSIKRSASDTQSMNNISPGGRFTTTGITLTRLITTAYNVGPLSAFRRERLDGIGEVRHCREGSGGNDSGCGRPCPRDGPVPAATGRAGRRSIQIVKPAGNSER